MILDIPHLFETKKLLRYMEDTVLVCYNGDIQLLFGYMKDTVVVYSNQGIQLAQNDLNQKDTKARMNAP